MGIAISCPKQKWLFQGEPVRANPGIAIFAWQEMEIPISEGGKGMLFLVGTIFSSTDSGMSIPRLRAY